MEVRTVALEIIDAVKASIKAIKEDEVKAVLEAFVEAYKRGNQIIVVGMGRSGLVARSFAMRLMHLGYDIHVVGETITPAMHEGDILFAISGSGTTTFVVAAADIARKAGGRIITLTSYPESVLGKLSHLIVRLPGRTKREVRRNYVSRQIFGNHEPLAPLGTLFEIASQVFLDSLIADLMKELGKTEEELAKRHATIE